MKRSVFIRFTVIVSLALVLTLLISNYLKSYDDTETIYLAKDTIQERTVITADMIDEVKIGAYEKAKFFKEAETEKSNIVGKISKDDIEKDSLFKIGDVRVISQVDGQTMKDGEINDPFFIDENNRLMLVNLTKTQAMSEKIKKGTYVDIVFTSTDSKTGGIYANVIVQHILVYDTETKTDTVDVYFKTTVENCALITLANETGHMSLVLNPLNGKTKKLSPAVPSDFYN